MSTPVKLERLAAFMKVYKAKLTHAVKKYPEEYLWADTLSVDEVARRMERAFERGSYNINGRAIDLTCKTLGLKPTRESINAYLYGY